MRTNIYIDGFNLYYGCLKHTSHKWLDLKKLCENILSPENKIQKIKLFTARVKPTETDRTAHLRQDVYLRALQAYIPQIEIIFGHFLEHAVSMPIAEPSGKVKILNGKPQFVTVCKREEKGSDVNLAVHFLCDAMSNQYDCGVIISNDSDLAEPVRLVRMQKNKKIGIISPHPKVSKELSKHSHFQRTIRESVLRESQLPDMIPATNLKKPDSWM